MENGLSAAIDAIWEKSREETGRRVATLEAVAAVLPAGGLDDGLRERAERDAHKLAGSLGMFGFSTGSERARELEQLLGAADGPQPSDVPRFAELVLGLRGELDERTVIPPGDRDDDGPAPAGTWGPTPR